MSAEPDLFPDAVMPCPRLAWLARHRLQTKHEQLPRGRIGPWNTKPWTCCDYGMILSGFGDTEEDACWEYARMMGIKHWLEDMRWMENEPHVSHWIAGEEEWVE